MKFTSPMGGCVEWDIDGSTKIVDATKKIEKWVGATGHGVAHLVYNKKSLENERRWQDYNIGNNAVVVIVFKSRCHKATLEPPQYLTRQVVHHEVNNAREALGLQRLAEESEVDEPASVPSFIHALLRERGMDGTGLGSLLETLEAVMHQDIIDDGEPVPPAGEREAELDRCGVVFRRMLGMDQRVVRGQIDPKPCALCPKGGRVIWPWCTRDQ